MKRFHFPLERVRRWRDGQAALEEVKLEQLREGLAALGAQKRGIESERARSLQQVLHQPAVEAVDLHNLDAYRVHARDQIRAIENREREAETRLEQQRQRVIQARRDAELLERLKQKALQEWQAASDREQESLAAELYLARRTRHW